MICWMGYIKCHQCKTHLGSWCMTAGSSSLAEVVGGGWCMADHCIYSLFRSWLSPPRRSQRDGSWDSILLGWRPSEAIGFSDEACLYRYWVWQYAKSMSLNSTCYQAVINHPTPNIPAYWAIILFLRCFSFLNRMFQSGLLFFSRWFSTEFKAILLKSSHQHNPTWTPFFLVALNDLFCVL